MSFIETCRQLVAFETTPSQGTYELVQWVAQLAREKGLHVEIQEEFRGDLHEANIIVRPLAERPVSEFLLQTHLDTSDPGPYGMWQQTEFNPFDAHIRDGKIYGLGTADVKLDFLCKLEALAHFAKNEKWTLPPVLVGTFGEESGMSGALRLVRKNKIAAKYALIGEPSNLRISHAAKGYASVEIRIPFSEEEILTRREHNLKESTSTQSRLFHGKAAHSSTPHLGESAIIKMLDYLLQLPDGVIVMELDGGTNYNTVPSHAFLELDLGSSVGTGIGWKIGQIYQVIRQLLGEFEKHHDKDFYPPHATLNIGLIRTYEDHILISGSCRIPPSINNEVYEVWMQKLQIACQAQGATFRLSDYKRPFRADENSAFVKGCLSELSKMGLSDQLTTQPSTNEASIFSRVGIECLCFGPGLREDNLHTPNEHVDIKDLELATEFYKRVIERFCI